MANKRSFGVATVSSQFKWPQRLRFTPLRLLKTLSYAYRIKLVASQQITTEQQCCESEHVCTTGNALSDVM